MVEIKMELIGDAPRVAITAEVYNALRRFFRKDTKERFAVLLGTVDNDTRRGRIVDIAIPPQTSEYSSVEPALESDLWWDYHEALMANLKAKQLKVIGIAHSFSGGAHHSERDENTDALGGEEGADAGRQWFYSITAHSGTNGTDFRVDAVWTPGVPGFQVAIKDISWYFDANEEIIAHMLEKSEEHVLEKKYPAYNGNQEKWGTKVHSTGTGTTDTSKGSKKKKNGKGKKGSGSATSKPMDAAPKARTTPAGDGFLEVLDVEDLEAYNISYDIPTMPLSLPKYYEWNPLIQSWQTKVDAKRVVYNVDSDSFFTFHSEYSGYIEDTLDRLSLSGHKDLIEEADKIMDQLNEEIWRQYVEDEKLDDEQEQTDKDLDDLAEDIKEDGRSHSTTVLNAKTGEIISVTFDDGVCDKCGKNERDIAMWKQPDKSWWCADCVAKYMSTPAISDGVIIDMTGATGTAAAVDIGSEDGNHGFIPCHVCHFLVKRKDENWSQRLNSYLCPDCMADLECKSKEEARSV